MGEGEAFAPVKCGVCGKWHYHNSKPCAGALVVRDGKVLLAQRGVEPFKGYWDIPGGFLEAGEHPEHGAFAFGHEYGVMEELRRRMRDEG